MSLLAHLLSLNPKPLYGPYRPKTKQCSMCRKTFPLEDFPMKVEALANGDPAYRAYCKPCQNKKSAESYARRKGK